MAARAIRFLSSRLRQLWHCRQPSHRMELVKHRGRYFKLGCSCGEVFWRREIGQ